MFLRQFARDFFAPRPSAGALLCRSLKAWPITAASFDDVASSSPVPYLRYRSFIYRALNDLPDHGGRIEPFDEARCTESICLADIAGCTASREADPSFAAMNAHGALDGLIAKSDADALATQMLTRDERGVSEAGKPVTVMRHSWDGQMWISNIDGSHRTAALWEMDRRVGTRRMIDDCEIIELTPSKDLERLMTENEIWLVASHDFPADMPYEVLREAGISIRPLDRFGRQDAQAGGLYRIAVPRSFEGFEDVAALMPPQAALSVMASLKAVPSLDQPAYAASVYRR